jgi:hypothetical protein
MRVLVAVVLTASLPHLHEVVLRADGLEQRPNSTTRAGDQGSAERDFENRVKAYMQLRDQLVAKLPKLPKDATPQQIDRDQRALGELVAQARANAKPGDLFTPAVQRLVRDRFAVVFQGTRGREAKKYIHDEPHPVSPEINKRYPDTIPLSTMPPRVLAELPKLPDGLEYRFIDSHLILMDVRAHMILDYIPNAIPNDTASR